MLNRLLTALATLAVALLYAAAPASAQRDVPQNFYGVNYDADIVERAPAALQDEQFGRQASAGVETTRVVFSWDDLQPRKGEAPEWGEADRYVQYAAVHGIEILPVVLNAPRWARENPRSFHSPPRDPRHLAVFMKLLIERYGTEGTYWMLNPGVPRRPLRTWQIWNEPHLRFQWDTPKPWAPGYGRQLRAAYKAVKQADPGATVVMAAMANESWKYLAEAYRKGRVRGFYDVAAMHPYTRRPDGVIALSRRFRTVMRRNRDSAKPLWITELGLPASRGREKSKNALQTTDGGMADFLTTSVEKLAAFQNSRNVRVSRVYWYTWASVYCCGDIFRYTGLRIYDPRNQTLRDKPAYAAFVESARRHQGCVKNSSGACQ